MKTWVRVSSWRIAALASSALLLSACDDKVEDVVPTGCEEQSDCRASEICENGVCIDRPVVTDECGDGELNPGELCETGIDAPFPGSCPTTCGSSNDRCGIYELIDDECQTRCNRIGEITDFIDGDLCCPSGATTEDDADCAIECGNGIIEGDEVCDDGEDNGTPGLCNDTCDAQIPGVCGDGVIDWNEECDDEGESETCNPNCTLSVCGDTIPNPTAGEACDDGGESANCNADCTLAACGDGVLNESAGETCDDGDQNGEPNQCNSTCTGVTAGVCGNGVVEGDEVCDDGEETAACNANCTAASCGDGIHNAAAGEACDDGNTSNTDGCLTTCELPACGDGFVQAGIEVCDDGALNGEPGQCNSTCSGQTAAECGNNFVDPGEDCDEGGVHTATCNANCTTAACGDGIRNPVAGEACDDGNTSNTDACLTTCEVASCGDGFLQAGVETCDDGAENGQPGKCNATCTGQTAAVCGNNIIEAGEDCDQGGVHTATCNANCTTSACGDGVHNPAADEECDEGGATATCSATCQAIVELDGFRVNAARVIDPHIFVNVPIFGCNDVTNDGILGQLPGGVNGMLSDSLVEVENGKHTFSIGMTASPLQTTDGAVSAATLEFPDCFASPMACVRDLTKQVIEADITYQVAGACLPPNLPGRRASYTGLNNPTGNCFISDPQTVIIEIAEIPITLTDARMTAKVTGSGDTRTLTDGVLFGFFSRADADQALLPADLTLVGGNPISDLLRGGGGCGSSTSASDLDTYEGVEGWWFYLNFTAAEVPFSLTP